MTTLTPYRLLRVLAVWLVIAAAAFVLSMAVSPRVGAVGLDFAWPDRAVFVFRLQRVLAAGLVGFALAAAGVTFQALLRNPLADPYVLGISSGSTVGVMAWLLAITLLPPAPQGLAVVLLTIGRSVPAILGAIATCLAVFFLARAGAGRRWNDAAGLQPVTLLLVGVVVSSINAAILMLLNAIAPHGLKANFATFLLGAISEGELTATLLTVAALVLAAGYLPTLLSAAALNIGTLSDVQAASLGVNIRRLRTLAFFCASIMTASAILLSGPIGFVGLICPHICRRLRSLGGPDHRALLLAAPLCGAAFLMLADSAVRVSATLNRGEFPVGVVTALCGGPFFLFLLRRRLA